MWAEPNPPAPFPAREGGDGERRLGTSSPPPAGGGRGGGSLRGSTTRTTAPAARAAAAFRVPTAPPPTTTTSFPVTSSITGSTRVPLRSRKRLQRVVQA